MELKADSALISDSELIQEYISTKSERAAFEIVQRHKNFVFATALRYTRSYDDAEDITQETFIKAFNNLHKFEEKSTLTTWLYRITVNTFLNSKKRRKIYNVFAKDDSVNLEDFKSNQTDPEQYLEFKELNENLMKALLVLPKKQREVFSLRFFEQMKYEDMSKLLGKTTGGLKANYYHAIRKIIKALGKQYAEKNR